MTEPRPLDLVLFGATGFVGRLTAAHLAHHAAELRVGLAGRSAGRLETLKNDLPPAAADWPTLVADSDDTGSLDTLARQARVVISTVGPYAVHGLPLVGACAAAGTDYVDLTGEVLFVRDSIDLFGEPAQTSGARIVHSCGFDSVPSDLAVLRAADAARDAGAGRLADTTLFVRRLRGGLSGGTIASMRGQLDEASAAPERARLIADPYALSPVRSDAPAIPEPEVVLARTGDRWHAPFVMGPFNRQVVHRSNALQDLAYGPGFKYREVVDTGRGRRALGRAVSLAGLEPLLTGGLGFAPTRALLDRLLPSPGDGPSAQQRARGAFAVEVVATTTEGAQVSSTVAADVDPGYDGTAVMLAEAARTLLDRTGPGGVLTPATALGSRYAARLGDHGFRLATSVS